MPHKYRAAIGRESLRPASRGIIAYPKPRRRNCRRAISLAASTWVGNSAFCRLLCANKRRWLPGIRQKGAVDSSADIPDMRVCGAITFLTITHGCRAAVPFGQSPKRHQKRFCSPAPGGFRLTASPKAPNQLGERPFLLMRAGYGLRPYPASFGKAETLHPRKPVSTPTPVAGGRPAGLNRGFLIPFVKLTL